MRVVTPEQMREIDSLAINQIGIPGILLMENASLKVVEEIEKDFSDLRNKKVTIFAGKGNNGGDALAVARHLHNKGVRINVYLLFAGKDLTGDAAINLKILKNMDVQVKELLRSSAMKTVKKELATSDAIVDGIFGTGLKGRVDGVIKELIDEINCSGKWVISIDIPSGVCGNTGRILGSSVKAAKTVTFALPKTGLVVFPGCQQAGELVVADIGIPGKLVERLDIKKNLLEDAFISDILPKREQNSSKGSFGKVMVISGSVGMTGAGCLTAGAALRTGAGLVYMGVPEILTYIYDAALTEVVTIPLKDDGIGCLSAGSVENILERIQKMSVVAIGPGLSTGNGVSDVVRSVVCNSNIPLVLDADALNVIAEDISILFNLKTEAVITPHPGEMARLTGLSIEEVQRDRIDIAVNFAVKWRVVTVLKGARTVVALPDGTVYINPTGNSGMATAGAGDVLTGIIAGLIGQGMDAGAAAAAGVYLHGLTGDKIAKIKGEHGLVAGDLVEELPYIIKGYARTNK